MIKQIKIAIANRRYQNAKARYKKSRNYNHLSEQIQRKNELFRLQNPDAIGSAW